MAARRCRMRTLPAIVAGALVAAGLVIPAAASERLDPAAAGTVEIDLVGDNDLRDPVEATGIGASTLTSFATADLLSVDDRGTGLPAFGASLAQRVLGTQAEVSSGAATAAGSGSLTSPTRFGLPGSSVSTSGPESSVSTVSPPVVVPAEALWTFDAQELTITSTIPLWDVEINVGLRGHQAEIDRCAGPVVSDYGTYGKVIGEHNHCGGAYVLELEVGDVVHVTGYEAGSYVVAFLTDVPKKNTPVTVLSGADLFLQTCHFTGGQMRLAALTPIS